MRGTFGVILISVICVCVLSVVMFTHYVVLGTPVVTYTDELVSCGTIHRPFDGLAVHSGRENFLRVGGKIYRRVRGLKPFYLQVPQLASILFVTDAGEDGVEFHVVRTSDWRELCIRGEKLSFGAHIRYPNTPGDAFSDFVEAANTNQMTLTTRYPDARTRIFLDLTSKRVTKVEYDEIDPRGRVTSQHVYKDGKRIE